MSQPELVIFDCDGTLVDSEIIAGQVDTALLAEAGVKISVEEFNERYAGLTFGEAVMRVESDFKVPLQASIIDRSKAILDRRLAEAKRLGFTLALAPPGTGVQLPGMKIVEVGTVEAAVDLLGLRPPKRRNPDGPHLRLAEG